MGQSGWLDHTFSTWRLSVAFVGLVVICRHVQYDIVKAVDRFGWRAKLSLSEGTRNSFNLLLENLENWNGYPIQSSHTSIPLKVILGPDNKFTVGKAIPNHSASKQMSIVAGDASGSAVCAYTIKNDQQFYFQEQLSERESHLSSGHRELLTVKKTLQTFGFKLKSVEDVSTVYWITDSTG